MAIIVKVIFAKLLENNEFNLVFNIDAKDKVFFMT